MSAVIEVPQLDCWFLVDLPGVGTPSVLMEFATRAEAEAALHAAFGDGGGREAVAFRLVVRSALAMLEDPELREALTAWDLEFSPA